MNSFGQLNLINPKSGVTKTFPLQVGVNVVGSGQQAHIQIYKNDILPIHFSLEVHKNKMVVVSTFSNMNPIYLNDKPLRKGKSELVKPSDVINFSNFKAVYENNLIQDQDLKQFQQMSKNSKFFSTPRRSNILIGGCFRSIQKNEKQNPVSKSDVLLSSSQHNTNTKTINGSPKHFNLNNFQLKSELSLPTRKSQRKSVLKNKATINKSEEYFLNIISKHDINLMNKDVSTSTLQNETLPFGFNVSLCSDNIENETGASADNLNSDEYDEKYRTPKAASFFAPLTRSSLKKSRKIGGDNVSIPNNMDDIGLNHSERVSRSLNSKTARRTVLRNSAGNIITRADRCILSPSNFVAKRKKGGSASPLSLQRSKRYKILKHCSRASLNVFASEKLTSVIKPFKSERKDQKYSDSSLYEDTTANTSTITSDSFIFETPSTFQQNTIIDGNISGIDVLESSLQSSIINSEQSEYDSNANKDYWSPIYCSTTDSLESELNEDETNDLSIKSSLINSNETKTRKRRDRSKGSMNELSFKSVSNLTQPIKDSPLRKSIEEDLEVCSGSALYSNKLIYPISSKKGNIYQKSEIGHEESKYDDVSNELSTCKLENLISKKTRSSENSNSLSHSTKLNKRETVKYSKQRSPLNDLSDFQKEPLIELTDIKGIQKLFNTPIAENKPQDDIKDVEGVIQLFNSSKKQCPRNNDLTKNVNGITNLLKTSIPQKQPKYDLCDVTGVKQLFVSPKITHSPRNDLRDIKGVKKLLKTPKPQKEPNNDLCDVTGVKQLFVSPKITHSPRNDLRDIKGVKKLLKTPKPQKEPNNDLCDVTGVKQLFVSPKSQRSLNKDSTDVKEIKKLFKTPKPKKELFDSLSYLTGVKELLRSPTTQNSSRNELTNVKEVEKQLKTPKRPNDLEESDERRNALINILGETHISTDLPDVKKITTSFTSPQASHTNELSDPSIKNTKLSANNFSDVEPVRLLFSYNKKRLANVKKCTTEKKFQSSYVCEADYTDVGGVKRMFAEEEANFRAKMNVSGVSELFRDEFDKLIGKEPLRQYPGKNSPTKPELLTNDKYVLNSSPSHNSHIEQWIAEQNKSLPNTSTPINRKGSYEFLPNFISTDVQIDVNVDQLKTSTKGEKKSRSYSKQVDENVDNSAVKTRMRTRGANKNVVDKKDQKETDHIARVTRGRKVEHNFEVNSHNEKTSVQKTRKTRSRILSKENVELKSSSRTRSENKEVENELSKQKLSASNQNVNEIEVYVDLVSTRTRGRAKRIHEMKTGEVEVKPIKSLRKRKEEPRDNSIVIVESDNTSIEVKEIYKSEPSRTLRSTRKNNSTKNEINKKRKLDDYGRDPTFTPEKLVKKRTKRGTQKENEKFDSPIVDVLKERSLESTLEILPKRRTRKQISKIENDLAKMSESSSKIPKPNDKKVKFADNFVETHIRRKRDVAEVEIEEVLNYKKQKYAHDPMEMKKSMKENRIEQPSSSPPISPRRTRRGARKFDVGNVKSEELKMPKRKSNRKK